MSEIETRYFAEKFYPVKLTIPERSEVLTQNSSTRMKDNVAGNLVNHWLISGDGEINGRLSALPAVTQRKVKRIEKKSLFIEVGEEPRVFDRTKSPARQWPSRFAIGFEIDPS